MNTNEMLLAITRIAALNTKMEEMEAFGQVRLHADVLAYNEAKKERDALVAGVRKAYYAMPKLIQAGWTKRVAHLL